MLPPRAHSPPATLRRRRVRYSFDPEARRQLAAEIGAQFAAFAATGLPLDHANAHKHMHLHPAVGRLMIGDRPPLRPARGARARRAARRDGRARPPRRGFGDRALHAWSRAAARPGGAGRDRSDDHVFGLAWSGHMTAPRVCALLAGCRPASARSISTPPPGATRRSRALMPDYEHEAELAALLDPAVRQAAGRA